MFDDLIKAVKLLPSLPVGVKTAHAVRHFPAEKEMVEQHHRVGLAAHERVEQFFLWITLPF